MAGMNTSSSVSIAARHKESDREKVYTTFYHQGKPVCQKMFSFLHGVGKKRLRNIIESVKVDGLRPRVHGNTNRKPTHSLSHASIEYVVRFLYTYAEQHALLLPGRVPGYSRTDIQLLPSSVSTRAVWRVYKEAAEAVSTIHAVSSCHFNYLWRTLAPSIVVMKPRSDLCWQCQKNSISIMRTANLSETEKSSSISNALEHLRVVNLERSHYKSICEECKESVRAHEKQHLYHAHCQSIRDREVLQY